MARTISRRRAAWLAGLACAIPWGARAESTGAEERGAWAPALAAWGDSALPERGGERADAEALGAAPVLVAVGDEAAAAAASGANDATDPQAAEFPQRDETERWVPSFAFTSGIIGHRAEGSVESDSTLTYNYFMRQRGAVVSYQQPTPPATQCPTSGGPFTFIPAPSQVVVTRSLAEGTDPFGSGLVLASTPCSHFVGLEPRPDVLPTDGDDVFLTPFVGGSTEVMTPGLQGVPGRPRLFAHGDLSAAFSFVRNVAKEGVPGGIEYPSPQRVNSSDPNSPIGPPDLPPGSTLIKTAPNTTEGSIPGIGSSTAGEVQTLVASAGLGVAFTIDAMERRIRIKPSVEYMREEIEVTGRLVRAYQVDTGLLKDAVPGAPLINGVYLDTIDLQAAKTRPFYGIGPGLEIEMDAARGGPVVLSLFASGQAYYMLGDLDVHMRAEQDVLADGTYVVTDQTVDADWDFHIHQWAYRGGVGLRFRWLPED
jgi:hypothetical protein